jgi:copper chaperone CopZ
METFKFKTNINCGGCVAKIKPSLDEEKGISNWKIDTVDPQKILTVETGSLSVNEVIEVVKQAGFTIDKL